MKLIVLFILSFSTYAFSECQQYIDQCEYYSCVETIKKCGKRGYLSGFGEKYCRKFQSNESLFSSNGKEWIESVKSCLINEIEMTDESASCSHFKTRSISRHVPCYISSGYCELSKRDKSMVIKTIRGSLWRPSIIKAGLKILSQCK